MGEGDQMMRKWAFLTVVIGFQGWACASATTDLGEDSGAGVGGSSSSGGSSSGTGGTSGTGGKMSVGGSQGSGGTDPGVGGGTSSGGAAGVGGLSSGGASAGGSSAGGGTSGGTSSGGAGTGGTSYEGDCADKPSYAVWQAGTGQATGDLVIYQCNHLQAGCASLQGEVDYLFECVDSHTNNCVSQSPEGGFAWQVLGSCEELGTGGMGGMGGMGGAP